LANPKSIKLEPIDLTIKKKILVKNKSSYPDSLLKKAGIIPEKSEVLNEKGNKKSPHKSN